MLNLKTPNMNKIRTPEEIKAQIEGLQREKDNLPERSFFGSNNHALIKAQISVLEGKSNADSYYVDEHNEDYTDGDNEIFFAAEQAEMWLEGKRKENLFE